MSAVFSGLFGSSAVTVFCFAVHNASQFFLRWLIKNISFEHFCPGLVVLDDYLRSVS